MPLVHCTGQRNALVLRAVEIFRYLRQPIRDPIPKKTDAEKNRGEYRLYGGMYLAVDAGVPCAR